MKLMKTLKRQVGALMLIFIVTVAVVGTAGTLMIKVIQGQQAQQDRVVEKIINNEPISDAEMNAAMNSRANQFRVAGAGAQLINAVDVAPDANSVVSAYGGACIDKMVERGMSTTPRPTGSKPLPPDVTTSIPGCTSGVFTCSNGRVICSSKVCNSSNDCGDNSDEGSSMCGQARSCCQATNGCPGETGSSCASSCCCCPYGQVCDRVNPGRGCISAN